MLYVIYFFEREVFDNDNNNTVSNSSQKKMTFIFNLIEPRLRLICYSCHSLVREEFRSPDLDSLKVCCGGCGKQVLNYSLITKRRDNNFALVDGQSDLRIVVSEEAIVSPLDLIVHLDDFVLSVATMLEDFHILINTPGNNIQKITITKDTVETMVNKQ